MSSAEMQAYLTGVVQDAIANDKANRESLTFEVAKLSKLREGQRGVALSALTAEQKPGWSSSAATASTPRRRWPRALGSWRG